MTPQNARRIAFCSFSRPQSPRCQSGHQIASLNRPSGKPPRRRAEPNQSLDGRWSCWQAFEIISYLEQFQIADRTQQGRHAVSGFGQIFENLDFAK
jgi:hypothetical protein